MIVNCKHCNCEIKTFPSKAWRTNYCSSQCRSFAKEQMLKERQRECIVCKKTFIPRLQQIKQGNGLLCSIKCRNIYALPFLMTEESKQKSKFTYMQNLKAGKIKHLSGLNHPTWVGGPRARLQRDIASGKAKDRIKKYRSENPHKAREWSQKRNGLKVGRLPRGTIKAKGKLQNWQCAYCKCDISKSYHVDHIIPLSKGGEHAAENVQLTCPSCNVRKSNKLDFVPW